MPMPKYFVLNDENKRNSHGFRLLNAGGNFDRFKDNPVMLDTHDQRAVVGRWDNLEIKGSELIAVPVFDHDDPDAARIEGKVERGFMKAASLGIYIEEAQYVSLPDDSIDLVVTKWELLEGSVLGVPSNSNALAFYSKEGVQLSAADVLKSVQELAAATETVTNQDPIPMSKIVLTADAATALGIAVEHEDGAAISAAVVALNAKAKKAETAENELKTFKEAQANQLVDLAVQEGRIDATRKESFVKMATIDFQQAKDVLDAMPAKKELGAGIKTGGQGIPGDRTDWDYMKWAKEDPEGLAKLQVNDPDAFNVLRLGYKSKYSSEA
jgi:HK97 family phage prohead protease